MKLSSCLGPGSDHPYHTRILPGQMPGGDGTSSAGAHAGEICCAHNSQWLAGLGGVQDQERHDRRKPDLRISWMDIDNLHPDQILPLKIGGHASQVAIMLGQVKVRLGWHLSSAISVIKKGPLDCRYRIVYGQE